MNHHAYGLERRPPAGTAAAGREARGAARPDGIAHSVERLKAKHAKTWPGFSASSPWTHPDAALRTARCLSWFERAAWAHECQDQDTEFILDWIAFNAAYGQDDKGLEQVHREQHLDKLLQLDDQRVIAEKVHGALSEPVRHLLNNEYLFHALWRSFDTKTGNPDWLTSFQKTTRQMSAAMDRHDSRSVLRELFGRLSVLRNQLLHGSATWNGPFNRDSVRPGARVMTSLVPLFIDVMLEHPQTDWGPLPHPPGYQEGNRPRTVSRPPQ